MGRAEQIRGAVKDMDAEFAKDVLATLLAQNSQTSVYDKGVTGASQQSASGVKTVDSVDFANFAQAITYLKNKFKFKELSRFTTEADLVYVDTGDRRVLLTDRDDPARFQNNAPRRAVEDTYSSEDEYFENAFEPSYHRGGSSASKVAEANNSSSPATSPSANVEKTYQNDDNNNSTGNTSSPDSAQGNSRFSSLEL